jgi:hypothetical protein
VLNSNIGQKYHVEGADFYIDCSFSSDFGDRDLI